MDTGQSNETDAFENNEQSDINNENKKNKNETQQKPNSSVEVNESSADIMKKINEEAEKLDSIIDKNDIKVFSKYEDLNENELEKLLEEKEQNILKLNVQKEESKKSLSDLLNKINKTITDNYGILYKGQPDPEIMFELNKEIEFKKKEFQVSKNMNNSIKLQYNSINNQLNKKQENGTNIEEDAILLNNLRTENKKLLISIRKYKDSLNFPNKDEKMNIKLRTFQI